METTSFIGLTENRWLVIKDSWSFHLRREDDELPSDEGSDATHADRLGCVVTRWTCGSTTPAVWDSSTTASGDGNG